MGVNSISSGSPHVRPIGRTCGEPDEIKKNTHPEYITALFREQANAAAFVRRATLLRNDAAFQAITYAGGAAGSAGPAVLAVVRQAGVGAELAVSWLGGALKVTAPCTLIARATPGLGAGGRASAATLTVSDPTQKLVGLSVFVRGKEIKVALPQGDAAGSSVTLSV